METKFINVKKQKISPYLMVIFSFLFIIFLGAFLLTCPFTHIDGQWGNFDDSLYIATSATCVTGADCFPQSISAVYNIWGQIFVALMIQVGGLGFITVLVFFITIFKKKLAFRDRVFISQAVSSENIKDVSKFVRKLLLVSLIFELIGFFIGLPVFFLLYENKWEALWGSAFLAVSAFNNAGFDIFGNASLILNYGVSVLDNLPQWAYHYLCSYVMVLVVFGGLSFLVLFEVFSFKKPKQWRVFTKICILMAILLIFGGAGLFMLTDGINNSMFTPADAFVQSITCRTAGFASFDPYQLSVGGRITSCFLMFVGGSPLGTASGIKTTTLFIIILTIVCFFRGKRVSAFKRSFSQNTIVKAMAVTITSIFIVLAGYFAISMFEKDNPLCTGDHAIFEVISCFSTTGFTTPLTVTLTLGGKLTCCVLMFLGRLGPMTMIQVFSSNMNVDDKNHYRLISEDILIG